MKISHIHHRSILFNRIKLMAFSTLSNHIQFINHPTIMIEMRESQSFFFLFAFHAFFSSVRHDSSQSVEFDPSSILNQIFRRKSNKRIFDKTTAYDNKIFSYMFVSNHEKGRAKNIVQIFSNSLSNYDCFIDCYTIQSSVDAL